VPGDEDHQDSKLIRFATGRELCIDRFAGIVVGKMLRRDRDCFASVQRRRPICKPTATTIQP